MIRRLRPGPSHLKRGGTGSPDEPPVARNARPLATSGGGLPACRCAHAGYRSPRRDGRGSEKAADFVISIALGEPVDHVPDGPFFGFGALTADSGTFRFRAKAKQAMLIMFETKEAR
jgi:hypothetical protein